MTNEGLISQVRSLLSEETPLPGRGHTSARHLHLMEIGRKDLSLARLAEAHYDAVAILAEANRVAVRGAIYGVWASEIPGSGLELVDTAAGLRLNGRKLFCSGGSLVDRALVTVTLPEHRLVEIDLRAVDQTVEFDDSAWVSQAFKETRTSSVCFRDTPVSQVDFVGGPGWYLSRSGFWHGACGPAACWAGGAEGLVEYALKQKRNDAHTLAHLGAMQSSVWAARSFLQSAGDEIDRNPDDEPAAQTRALKVRHLIERACSDVLERFARAYGPYPLCMQRETTQRYQELDLYLRQCHAERDLEQLGMLLRNDETRRTVDS